MKEEWKDIKGYEGYYQVSNLGNIKSFIYFNGHEYIYRERILKPQNNRYLTVRLAKNKKVKQYTINISNCCKKNAHTAGGYIWQYAR